MQMFESNWCNKLMRDKKFMESFPYHILNASTMRTYGFRNNTANSAIGIDEDI